MYVALTNERPDSLKRWSIAAALAGLTLLAACGGGSGTAPQGPANPPAVLVPLIQASISVSIAQPLSGQEVRLSPRVSLGTSTASPTLTVTQVVWNFGDGSPDSSISNAASFTTPQYKSYAQTGTYLITLSATDSAGRSGSITRTVSVQSFAATGKLNDTGIDRCSENITTPSTWINNAICSAVNWAGNLWGTGQDAYHGRDAQAAAGTLAKQGSGAAGFDFTRLGGDGQPLAIQNATFSPTGNEQAGTRWDCIKDNHTGLIWEIKRMDDPAHLRYFQHLYSWYNDDSARNDGAPGVATPMTFDRRGILANACTGVADLTKCNTQSYQTAVNALPSSQALCGFRDWRMPSKDELISITHLGRTKPAMDAAHFPDGNLDNGPRKSGFWSSSPYSLYAAGALTVTFDDGRSSGSDKERGHSFRLVRSGQ